MTLDEWATVADSLAPQVSGVYNERPLNAQRFAIQCGILMEMPRVKPSTVEIAYALGSCHSKVQYALKRWSDMPWRDRHGWLMLAEGRAA